MLEIFIIIVYLSTTGLKAIFNSYDCTSTAQDLKYLTIP